MASVSFAGHMLVNWYLSEFAEDSRLLQLLNGQDLKLLAIQFCTHLLAAGVLRQIPDKDVPMYNIFKVNNSHNYCVMITGMKRERKPFVVMNTLTEIIVYLCKP